MLFKEERKFSTILGGKGLTSSAKFERIYTMTTLNTTEAIDAFRLCALRGALKLEILGMRKRGQSAYSIIKQEFGFKGNKQKVLEQLQSKIDEIKGT